MPTINEVWEQALQINANLVTLHDDMGQLQACCQETNNRISELIAQADESNDWLQELREITNDGFAAMSDGFTGVHLRQDLTNRLLAFQAQQMATMICILENISRNTCQSLNQQTRQTDLQERMQGQLEDLHFMFSGANSEQKVALDRHKENRSKIEECCPPEAEEPPCSYKPCDEPKAPRPSGQGNEIAAFGGFDKRPSRTREDQD